MNISFANIKNDSDRKISDISSEATREYTYQHGREPMTITIISPIGLSVSGSGHYIFAGDGSVSFMPNGFVMVKWTPREGAPNIVV